MRLEHLEDGIHGACLLVEGIQVGAGIGEGIQAGAGIGEGIQVGALRTGGGIQYASLGFEDGIQSGALSSFLLGLQKKLCAEAPRLSMPDL